MTVPFASIRSPSRAAVTGFKACLFLAALLPLAKLAAGAFLFPEWLGANPAEFITRSTGDWALRMLIITLCVTPLRRLLQLPWVLRLRRMFGLFAFFYALNHFSSYIAFDHVFDVNAILKDIVKRPFITVGFTCFVLMLPLAVTSANSMIRWLGAKRWTSLHRLVYVIGPLAVLHFWWMVKRDITEPAIYALVMAFLLGVRLKWRLEPAGRRAPAV